MGCMGCTGCWGGESTQRRGSARAWTSCKATGYAVNSGRAGTSSRESRSHSLLLLVQQLALLLHLLYVQQLPRRLGWRSRQPRGRSRGCRGCPREVSLCLGLLLEHELLQE